MPTTRWGAGCVLAVLIVGCRQGMAAAPPPTTAAGVVQATAAARVFARAHQLCSADNGKLWGVSLCVPMMLANPKTQEAVANRPTVGGTRDGRVFRLELPSDATAADTPFQYGGVRWAEVLWPMYGNAQTQAVTLMHESFHVIQPELGFKGYAGTSGIAGDPSLDTQEGRVWFRGALHALRAALEASGTERQRAVRDALAMRQYRLHLFPKSAQADRELNTMEGLAEGTGIDVGLPHGQRIAYALHDIAMVEKQPSFARAFPYATGPAYTELLDTAEPGWRHSVAASSDLALILEHAYGMQHVGIPTAAQADAILARYGGAKIRSQEAARAAHAVLLAAKYKHELVAGPTIALPMVGFKISFNPRDIQSLPPYGSVYHTLVVTAPWGRIQVSGGDALISNHFRVLSVAVPVDVNGSDVQGRGWTLELANGYAIAPNAKKPGSYAVFMRR